MWRQGSGWIARILLLVVAILWVRSYWIESRVFRYYVPQATQPKQRCFVFGASISRGRFRIVISCHTMVGRPVAFDGMMVNVRFDRKFQNTERPAHDEIVVGRPGVLQDWFGIAWRHDSFSYSPEESASVCRLLLPIWVLLIPALFVVIVRVLRAQRVRNRRKAGRCERCGYDLRATPERCSECGKVRSKANERGHTASEIFPNPVDGRDNSSGVLFHSVDEHDAVDQLL
jgi:hypothetical protein